MNNLGGPRRQRPVPGSFALSMVGAAARGAGLIALAVGIGVVLMWVGDDDGAGAAAGRREATTSTGRRATTSSSTPASTSTSSSSTTTTTAVAAVAPSSLKVLVLNGTEKPNQARPLSARLREAGYQTLTPSDAPERSGSVLFCRPAAQGGAAALAAATGLSPSVEALDDDSDLPGADEADCVVVIGAT